MRRIKNYTLDDLDRDLVTKYFMAYSSAKDEKYEEFIEEARDIVFEKVKVPCMNHFQQMNMIATALKMTCLRKLWQLQIQCM